jgi:hypothetical protein
MFRRLRRALGAGEKRRMIVTRRACIMWRFMRRPARMFIRSIKCSSILAPLSSIRQLSIRNIFFADPDGLKLEFVFRG